MKRTVEFKDAKRNKVVAECEITNRNGYPEFTMSGEYAGSMGQCFDSVEPATEEQKKLIDIWNEWHLNGINAGTKEQEKAIEEWEAQGNEYDYTKAVIYLKSIGLFKVPHPETEEPYKYGHGWIRKDLPEDFEDELNKLLDAIEEYEEDNSDRPVEEDDIDLFNDFDEPETALALALMLDLTVDEINDIEEEGNNRWRVQGTDYVAGTDDEMDEACKEYIGETLWAFNSSFLSQYMGDAGDYAAEILSPIQEKCESGNDAVKALVGWNEDADEIVSDAIRVDGRGHFLNPYDGSEETIRINNTDYFAYRQ